MVLSTDAQSRKISLGMKQLTDDPWDELTKSLVPGSQMNGKVTRIVNFGLFVQLENGLEGLVHISEIPGIRGGSLEKSFEVGSTVSVNILHIDHEARKIALSCKAEVMSTA